MRTARDLTHKHLPLSQQFRVAIALPTTFYQYSVASRVQLPVVAFTAWATAIYLLHCIDMVPNVGGGASSITGILSMVTGLMVSFRSGSSYDRWYEGRRVWSSIQSTSRTFLRLLIFSLPPPTSQITTASTRQAQAINELCSLVCAFSFATMYRLRDQPGISHPELRGLLPQSLIESFEETPSAIRRQTSIDSTGSLHHSSASEASRAMAGVNTSPSSLRSIPSATAGGAPTNLPLSLIRAMHAYLNAFHATPMASEGSVSGDTPALDGATWANCLGGLKEFTDSLTALERIRDTPIPLILSLHLQLLLFVYIAAVPLQLVKGLGIWSIPATAIAAIVFYGVDRAGEELSDPFGTEPNDLPLERFCADIHREYLELVGTGAISGSAGNDWKPSIAKGY